MHLEGRLQIDLYPVVEQTNRVSIQSSRPLQAVRIFQGKTPQEVLMQLPLLFNVCGIAQATASIQAFQQALAIAGTAPEDTARALLMHMETIREHLWRILIDWPELIDESADAHQLAALQPMLQVFRQALFSDGDAFSLLAELRVEDRSLQEQFDRLDEMLASLVFGCPPAQWLQMTDKAELDDWSRQTESVAARLLRQVSESGWQNLGAADCGFLPTMPEAELNHCLEGNDAGQFIAEPVWQERICETTSLTRQHDDSALIQSLCREYGNGLLTRLAARLVELARIPASMQALAATLRSAHVVNKDCVLPAGIGIAQVEAARGRLVHRVVLDDGQVRNYQIVAPTEWNFHPAGVVARGLANLSHTDEGTLRRQAAMLINAVDPCVGYDLKVH